MRVSIIVAARNEEDHLTACLDSLLKQTYKDFEILVIDGRSDDHTKAVAERYAKRHKRIKVYDNPRKRAAEARNIGIKHAKGRYIGYIDAHTTASKDWLRTLVKTLEKHPAWKGKKVGGVGSVHEDTDRDTFSAAVTAAFQNPLGGGTSSYGKGSKVKAVDTAYACLYRREALDAIKEKDYYDPSFVKGQDADLNWRLNKAGHVLLRQPKAITYYEKRKGYGAFWRQMYVAGYWRAKLTLKHKDLLRPYLFAPLVIYLPIIALLIIGIWYPLALATAAAYLLLYVVGTFTSALLTTPRMAVRVTALLLIMHLGYSSGLTKGFVSDKIRTKDRV
ncbi:glycosyltransferase [Candidatus Woesearchaeota archaeon]|nr:glycosyltransferase [Candidatus Woesearchaeota archaeon]